MTILWSIFWYFVVLTVLSILTIPTESKVTPRSKAVASILHLIVTALLFIGLQGVRPV